MAYKASLIASLQLLLRHTESGLYRQSAGDLGSGRYPGLSSVQIAATAALRHFQTSATFLANNKPDISNSISVTFTDEKDGSVKKVQVPLGTSLLEAAHENNIDLEGACEGSLACSTCHVIVEDQGFFDKLPEPEDDENDMLDLAFGLTEMSRLGCQIIASKELDGLKVRIPGATRNFAVDGYVPKPH